MAMACKICNHPDKLLIERELVQGLSITKIARRYGVSTDGLYHHRDNHLSRQLVQSWQKRDAISSANILSEIEGLISRTKNILIRAEAKGEDMLALTAIREARGGYELLSKIAFALHQARLSEIELERMKGKGGSIEELTDFQEKLGILSVAELKLLLLLQDKISKQDETISILELAAETILTGVGSAVYERTEGPGLLCKKPQQIAQAETPGQSEAEEVDEFRDLRVVPFFPPRTSHRTR